MTVRVTLLAIIRIFRATRGKIVEGCCRRKQVIRFNCSDSRPLRSLRSLAVGDRRTTSKTMRAFFFPIYFVPGHRANRIFCGRACSIHSSVQPAHWTSRPVCMPACLTPPHHSLQLSSVSCLSHDSDLSPSIGAAWQLSLSAGSPTPRPPQPLPGHTRIRARLPAC